MIVSEAGGEAAGSSVGRPSDGMPGSVTVPGCLEPGTTLPDTRSELPSFRPPCTLGFREVPLRAVREGWMETKGLWDRVGFQKVPLRGVREG